MAILPYIPLGIDLFDRVYRLISKVRGKAAPAKDPALLTLQEDLSYLKEAMELQTKAFDQRESNLKECVAVLERQVRSLRFQVWGLGLALVATIIYFGMLT